MKCFYINLDHATARRDAIEQSFRQHKRAGWTLTRVAAVDAAQVRDSRVPGSLPDEQKACLLSHKWVIGANRGGNGHILILEDDAIFGPSTFGILEDLLARADTDRAWDLIYTDLAIPRVCGMAEFLALRHWVAARGGMTLLDLEPLRSVNRMEFAGATAYVVNRTATTKLYDRLDSLTALDVPYDLLLREEIHTARLKAFVTVPFLTSVSRLADESSIQRTKRRTELIWNVYRRMFWRDGDWQSEADVIAALCREISPEAKLYGALWGCMADQGFQDK
jgi:GR25 family glycosyltransferase involved in LPS biosynthesis